MTDASMNERTLRLGSLTAFLGFVFISLGVISTLLLSPETLNDRLVIGLGSFFILSLLAEKFPLKIQFGHAYLGWSGTINWALVILFHPVYASLVAAISFLLSDYFLHRKGTTKSLFNCFQVGLSTLVAGAVLMAVTGGGGLENSVQFFVGFGCSIFTYWLLNTWLVSLGVQALYGEPSYRFWNLNFRWAFIFEITSSPIALAVAFAYDRLWIAGVVLLALPIVMVRQAYTQYLDLKRTYRETVRTLIKIIEMHDPYTAGHSDRVARYSRRLCEAVNLSPSKTERIELAAYLHDLGKINLDLNGIVRKAGRLTEEERRLVKLHPVMSADLANQVSYFKGEIEDMIRHHHENWDGSGYPHGLKSGEIPLGSRVILLADAFDAMTTSRVYREALDIERVKDEFRRFAGIQFDPELVPVFLEKVVGDGEGIIRQPVDEPLEGQRARAPEVGGESTKVHRFPRRVIG